MGKKMKVAQKSPMYTQTRTSADSCARAVKRASVLDLITLATDISSKKLKNGPP